MKIKKWQFITICTLVTVILLAWILPLALAPVRIGTTKEEFAEMSLEKGPVVFDLYSYYISKAGMQYVVQWKDDRVVAQWAFYPFLTTHNLWGHELLWEGMSVPQVLGFLGCKGSGKYQSYHVSFDKDGRLDYLLYNENPFTSYSQIILPPPSWTPWAVLGGIVLIAGTTAAIILIRRKKKQQLPEE